MPTLAETRRATRSRETFEWFDDLEDAAVPGVVDLAATFMVKADRIEMPPIVEFVEHPLLLARPRLYPRQKTILKLFFLELE
ncbi:MAG TPA: hypothetical protein VEM93_01955, partial [Actinomycetota bacterium]|nr:hypothetical protein [Actinomycetota bacterium]